MKRLLFLLPLAAFFAACSMKKAAVRVSADVMRDGASALRDEADIDLARQAFPAQIMLVEGLLVSDPKNPKLRLLAAEGFAAYAFLFLEESEPQKAKGFYMRARHHARLAGDSTQARFWEAFGWGSAINLARDDAALLAELPKAVELMKRVHSEDKEIYFAGPDLFFGTYYASRPAMLGGDTAKARTHFEWARRLTSGKYLMAYVYEARALAVALQDRPMFERLLGRVLEMPAGQLPGARLADEVAKKRAAALLEKADDLF